MKICDISSFYSERGGGVRTYHHQKLSYFERRPEHAYRMIVAGSRPAVDVVGGGTIYRVRGLPVTRDSTYRQICDPLAVRRILDAERPDVIEIGSAYLDCWLARLGCRGFRPVTVGLYHADFPDSYLAPAVSDLPRLLSRPFMEFWRSYVRFAYRGLDATCVTSRHIERKLERLGLRNTHLVPLGVDVRAFHPSRRDPRIREEFGVAPADRLVLFVGRFGSEKGVDVLLGAIRRLGGRRGVHLLVVGDGEHADSIRSAARSHANVHVLGYVDDHRRLGGLYASADIFLAPGPHETFGLCVLEAMSSGLPVIAAGAGGAAELVHASGVGRCFRPHDVSHMVRTILSMCESDLSVAGLKARSFAAERFSWERTFDRMMSLYARIAEARYGGAIRLPS